MSAGVSRKPLWAQAGLIQESGREKGELALASTSRCSVPAVLLGRGSYPSSQLGTDPERLNAELAIQQGSEGAWLWPASALVSLLPQVILKSLLCI